MRVIDKFVGRGAGRELPGDLPGYVYFISDRCGHIKIDHTTGDIRYRMDALQTGNALPLQLIGYFKLGSRLEVKILEEKLHTRFSTYRLCGEWFRINLYYDG